MAQAEGVHHPILEPAGRRQREASMAVTPSLRRLLDRLGRRGRVRPMRVAGAPGVRSVRRRLVASSQPPPPVAVIALDRTGQPLFSHRAPDGYPDMAEDWLSTGTLVATWRTVNWVLATHGDDDVRLFDVERETPEGARSPGLLADYWIERVLGRAGDPRMRQEIVDFLALGRDPEIPLGIVQGEDLTPA